jgi:CDP-glucose 4,6-dehydratase
MFWNSRRVFLTGHTGFKGAWLSLWLEQLGAAVTGFSLAPPMHPSLFAEAEIASGITSILGDIRSLAGLRETMRHAEPEILIHMAAQSLVRPSYADPAATYSTNVLGTVNVLEAARVCPSICAIVVVSSDHGALDPYATSKACVELITDSYRASFFKRELFAEHRVAIAVARCGNLIGGGDWAPGRLLPDAVRAIMPPAPGNMCSSR